MSEEESIKHCTDFIKENENRPIILHKAISTILDLYNKEKEKNKELENADLTTVYMNGFYDSEKKWKDKIIKYENAIKTKISSVELDRDYGRYKRYGGKIKCEKYLAQLYGYKKALQELLEEDNK